MENKQSKRRWKIPVLLVSAICILLASSFVFQITADALDYDYSLQTGYFQNPVDRDGSEISQSVDVSDFRNVSSTENNAYSSGTMNGSIDYFSPFTGEGRTAYGFEDYLYSYYSNGTSYVVCATQTYQYSFGDIFYPFGYSSSNSLYDLNGDNLYTAAGEIYCCTYYDSFYYVLYRSGSSTHYCNVAVLNESFVTTASYRIEWTSYSYQQILLIDGGFVVFKNYAIIIFDFENRSFSTVLYNTTSSIGMNKFVAGYDGESVYMFSRSSSTNSIKYVISTGSLSTFSSVTVFAPVSRVRCCSYYAGSFICNIGTELVTLQYQDYFFDFGSYIDSNVYTPDRYLNFEYYDTSSVLSGGFHVGIELEFGVSSLMFSQIALKEFNIGVTTLIAQDYMIESETTMAAPRPLNCWNGTNYITDYRTSYRYIGQRDGKYLYMCTSFCNFATQGRLNPIKVVINCYLPYQVSSHNYSIPVSMLTFTDEYSGGGGGESSGGGSSGGESSSSPSVDPGESSDDVPGENDPAFLKIYKVSSGGALSYICYFPTSRLSKVSVFFGSVPSFEYSAQGMYAISPSSSFLVLEYADSGLRIIKLDFYAQGWSKSSSLSSMHYPLFSGNVIEIDFTNTYSIYLADVVPYGQMRICDYDSTTYSLINLPAPDSVVNISQYSDTQFQVSCQGSVRYYPDKIARYKEYGFGSTSSWELYEEGSILQFSRLGSPLLNTVQLQTYTGEFPPHDPDYEEQIRIEESIRAELESRANELYGSVSFDPQDESDFDEAKQDVRDVLSSGSVIFNFINKLWNTNPFTSHFVVITATCAILAFVVRKL